MKTTLMVLLTVLLTALNNNMFEPQEPAIVYYSPKTTIVLDFTYTEEVQEVGQYALFAEQMLGVKDIVAENKTSYRLDNVSIGTRTTVDLSRAHKITPEQGVQTQLLSINEKGLLVGYNVPPQERRQHKNSGKECASPRSLSSNTVAYPEEAVEAKSLAAQAQAIAKQIFRLRESRVYILSGEVEKAPADGEAMKRVLHELDKQEQQLVALFVGKKTTRTLHKKVEYCPAGDELEKQDEQLFFSEENGFTDAENIDAEEISIHIDYQHQLWQAQTDGKKSKKKDVQPSQIVYNLPGFADVDIEYKGESLNNRTLPVAQFGIDMPLSQDLFKGEKLPSIIFSEKTGNIVSISK